MNYREFVEERSDGSRVLLEMRDNTMGVNMTMVVESDDEVGRVSPIVRHAGGDDYDVIFAEHHVESIFASDQFDNIELRGGEGDNHEVREAMKRLTQITIIAARGLRDEIQSRST